MSWEVAPEAEAAARGLPALSADVIYHAAREAVRAWAMDCGIAPYDQRANQGLLRHVRQVGHVPCLRTHAPRQVPW